MSEEQDPQSTSEEDTTSDEDESTPNAGVSYVANPYFNKSKRSKKEEESDSDSDISDSDDSDDEDDDSIDESEDDKSDKETDPVDEEDPLIKALKASREKAERKSPCDLTYDCHITDLSFHPKLPLIAHSTIDGRLLIHEYSNEVNELKNKSRIHKGSVRSIEFNNSGSSIVTGGEDKTFQVIDSVSTAFLNTTHIPSLLYLFAN